VNVNEGNKELIVAVSDDAQTVLLKYPMSDGELAEWKEFGDVIFWERTASYEGALRERVRSV